MKKKRVLLVEDDQFILELYEQLLKDAGYEVETADNGIESYKKIVDGSWDLILHDVMIPGMSGFEIIQKLKKENVKVACPIVFLTNLDSNDDDKAKLKSAQDYWIKSDMNPEEFITKVASAIS